MTLVLKGKREMLSVAVAAMPSMMEEKALVMEKALARSTRKVSADRSLLPYPPIVVGVPIGRFRRPCSLSMPPSLPLRTYPLGRCIYGVCTEGWVTQKWTKGRAITLIWY